MNGAFEVLFKERELQDSLDEVSDNLRKWRKVIMEFNQYCTTKVCLHTPLPYPPAAPSPAQCLKLQSAPRELCCCWALLRQRHAPMALCLHRHRR